MPLISADSVVCVLYTCEERSLLHTWDNTDNTDVTNYHQIVVRPKFQFNHEKYALAGLRTHAGRAMNYESEALLPEPPSYTFQGSWNLYRG